MTKQYAARREESVINNMNNIKKEMKSLNKFSKEELFELAHSYRLMTEGMNRNSIISDIAVCKITGYVNY